MADPNEVQIKVTTSDSWTILLADSLKSHNGGDVTVETVGAGKKGKAVRIKCASTHRIIPYTESVGTDYFTRFCVVKADTMFEVPDKP